MKIIVQFSTALFRAMGACRFHHRGFAALRMYRQVPIRQFEREYNQRYGRYVKINMENKEEAINFLSSLTTNERQSLLAAVKFYSNQMEEKSDSQVSVTSGQMKSLFLANFLPFVGFGLLDNSVMIMAGESIDTTLGALLGISTMAAAATGNMISDVGGVGVGHYIELLVAKIGVTVPVLDAQQMNSRPVRWVINMGRMLGIAVGCVIGMFPLLFFKEENEGKKKRTNPPSKAD